MEAFPTVIVKTFNYQILDPDPNSLKKWIRGSGLYDCRSATLHGLRQEFSCHKTLISRSCQYNGSLAKGEKEDCLKFTQNLRP